jgi:hypothetical protein
MLLQLHDDYGMSQGPSLDIWPPITWQEFRPNSREEILDHYYAYSLGCQSPTAWGIALASASAVATAGFGASLLAGAGAALKGIAAGTISGSNALIGATATKQITDSVKNSAKASAKKAQGSAINKRRRSMDSGAEKKRIVDTRMQNMTLAQLQAELPKLQKAVKDAEKKGKKVPCDTAGVRNMGVLNAALQYCQALIEAYKASGTSTPQEFNAKFSKAAADGKTRIGSALSGITLQRKPHAVHRQKERQQSAGQL